MADLTDDEYKTDARCPHCRSDEIGYTTVVGFNGDFISQLIICNSCGEKHYATYELSGYEVRE